MSSKKEIIYELLKGVIEKVGRQNYGIRRRKLLKSGVSEIALLSAVASHLDENDISSKTMIDDVLDLIDGCIKILSLLKQMIGFLICVLTSQIY
ncbi:hypothetical protein JK628_23065 (plasmid) [Shewanella sp. KX20019]|uniref:hypothetical protein n=1 Tax=Shewanella sp. KX20019 TaxID=2803864 RepID=UPI001927FB6F|nr:hypothetical protein [Shewanella sp. KX20019]QQX82695.1 hypothetical protein JK628_23065 [Shewanella sp. KX20019]